MRNEVKMAVLWVTVPSSLYFSNVSDFASISRAITLMLEAASTSETSVNFYQTTRWNNPEDICRQIRCHENLRSYNNEVAYSPKISHGDHLRQRIFLYLPREFSMAYIL
jgi:HD-like signal output (HDOD) protein